MNPFEDPKRQHSEELAFEAERAWAEERQEDAFRLFREAAKLEADVALGAPLTTPRARGVLAVSAVSLYYKGAAFEDAKVLAYRFLSAPEHLTDEGRAELEDLVDRCLREEEMARATGTSDMVPLECKLDGGRILVGVAPEPVARKRRERVQQLLMRSADWLAEQPYREQGPSELQTTEQIQVYEAPARAASYGLRFYVGTGRQVPTTKRVTPEQVVAHFLSMAAAAEQGPEAVKALVDDEQYARGYIEGFRDIAPDGKEVGVVACSAPTWRVRNAPRPVFEQKHRKALEAGIQTKLRPLRAGEREVIGKLMEIHAVWSGQWITLGDPSLPDEKREILITKDAARLIQRCVSLRTQEVRAIVRKPSGNFKSDYLVDIDPVPKQRSSDDDE